MESKPAPVGLEDGSGFKIWFPWSNKYFHVFLPHNKLTLVPVFTTQYFTVGSLKNTAALLRDKTPGPEIGIIIFILAELVQ